MDIKEVLKSLREEGAIRMFRTYSDRINIYLESSESPVFIVPQRMGTTVVSGKCSIYIDTMGNSHAMKNCPSCLPEARKVLPRLIKAIKESV